MSAEAGDRRSWLPTSGAFWITTGSTAIATGSVVFTLGSCALFFLSILVCIPLGLLVLACDLLASHDADCRRTPSLRESKGALIATVILIEIAGLVGGFELDEYRSSAARTWCDSLAPDLESWRAQHGEYPKELAQLGIELDPPLYCRRNLFYQAGPDGYVLDFSDDGPLSGWSYSSESGDWAHYH